jgi:hypothetical protein
MLVESAVQLRFFHVYILRKFGSADKSSPQAESIPISSHESVFPGS